MADIDDIDDDLDDDAEYETPSRRIVESINSSLIADLSCRDGSLIDSLVNSTESEESQRSGAPGTDTQLSQVPETSVALPQGSMVDGLLRNPGAASLTSKHDGGATQGGDSRLRLTISPKSRMEYPSSFNITLEAKSREMGQRTYVDQRAREPGQGKAYRRRSPGLSLIRFQGLNNVPSIEISLPAKSRQGQIPNGVRGVNEQELGVKAIA
ncbi:hypothetical protein MMC29_002080 [Sticta canariensis]|nr:hypothetical protein [Sticta canariensis]